MGNITQKKSITIADILCRLMEVKHMTNSQLAKNSGLSKNYICLLRNNNYNHVNGLRLSTINALAIALDVPHALFFNAPYFINENGEIKHEKKDEKMKNEKLKEELEEMFSNFKKELHENAEEVKKEYEVKKSLVEMLFDFMPITNYTECFREGYFVNKKLHKVLDAVNSFGRIDNEMPDETHAKFMTFFKEIECVLDYFIDYAKIDEILDDDEDDENE